MAFLLPCSLFQGFGFGFSITYSLSFTSLLFRAVLSHILFFVIYIHHSLLFSPLSLSSSRSFLSGIPVMKLFSFFSFRPVVSFAHVPTYLSYGGGPCYHIRSRGAMPESRCSLRSLFFLNTPTCTDTHTLTLSICPCVSLFFSHLFFYPSIFQVVIFATIFVHMEQCQKQSLVSMLLKWC